MDDHRCEVCGKTFRVPAHLKRHRNRKTPCAPILDPKTDNAIACRYCGRSFASEPSMKRHVRQYCKIANSEEGMEKLMEHTLQKQLADQGSKIDEQSAKVDTLQRQLAELTTLLKGQIAMAPKPPVPSVTLVNTGPVTQTTTNITNINIRSWSGDDRIIIPVSMVRAVFAENPRLVEYCGLSDADKTDAEGAAPYVLEALVSLVKRAHAADPASRNVYINPRRADQVLVFDEAAWRVLTLVEAIRTLFDGVADRLQTITVTDRERVQLPFDIQAAASWIPSLYYGEPDEYVRKARAPMSAHLANMAPPQVPTLSSA